MAAHEKIRNPVPISKLATGADFRIETLSPSDANRLNMLKKAVNENGFRVLVNEDFLV